MTVDFILPAHSSRRQRWLVTLGMIWLLGGAAGRVLASQSLELTWTDSFDPNLVSHNVYYGTQSGVYGSPMNFPVVVPAVIPGFVDGTTYYFAVSAVDYLGNESALSSEAVFTVPAPPPLTLQVQSSTAALDAVQLSWLPSSDSDVYGYYVQYGTQSGDYSGAMEFDDTTNGMISGLADGVTNYFIVSAMDSLGIQPISSLEVAYVVPVSAPIVVTAQTSTNPPGVTLNWNALMDVGAAGYYVYYGDESSNYSQTIFCDTTTNVLVTGLQGGQTYYFAVAVLDDYGNEGPLSQESSAAVPMPTSMVLQLQTYTDDNGEPYLMEIFNPSAVSGYWEIDSSTDLQNWTLSTSGYGYGYGYDVDDWVWIDPTVPQIFFRVVQ